MSRIFLDTNFLIDLFDRKEYAPAAKEIMDRGLRHGIEFCISFLSVANFAYILRKTERAILIGYLKDICDIFTVIPNEQNQILKATELEAPDLEDAIQYATAITNNCDCIITRNGKDFLYSEIPVLTPEGFLKLIY
ncbi:MAG: PIN domain-containing protein [Muribaculaceae bacterium]|nr:PIN domain-containing protein [Muribaculaceae bacterium]